MKEADITNAITSLCDSFQAELLEKTQEGLEDYWHFKYNPLLSLEINLYHFHDMLALYGNFCMHWEEAKHGSCCVVERVRDQYLMPKINDFGKEIREMINDSPSSPVS